METHQLNFLLALEAVGEMPEEMYERKMKTNEDITEIIATLEKHLKYLKLQNAYVDCENYRIRAMRKFAGVDEL